MQDINARFMEAYKHLDSLCRDAFRSNKGVTSYIEEMERTAWNNDPAWDAELGMLKKMRHARNRLAHDSGTLYEALCTERDIDWIERFAASIVSGTDPLARLQSRNSPATRREVRTAQTSGTSAASS